MAGMVTAEVKDFLYYGFDSINEPPVVGDPAHFGIQVSVLIGTTDQAPADSFTAFPCTASWLADELTAGRWQRLADDLVTEYDDNVRPLAGVWVMEQWSQERFEAAVHRLCATHSPAPDWGALASRLSRLLPWEYDDRYDLRVDAGRP